MATAAATPAEQQGKKSDAAKPGNPTEVRRIELPSPKSADDAQSFGRDAALAGAMRPVVERIAIDTLQNNPDKLIAIVYPVIGRAIRKSIGDALRGMVLELETQTANVLSLRGLRWRFQAWRTKRPYAEVVLANSLVFEARETLLIDRMTGIVIASASAGDESSDDRDLVSSMLSAIEDFARDSFHLDADASLSSFALGKLTLLVQSSPVVVLATAVNGTPGPKLHDHLNRVFDKLHEDHGAALADFDGDVEPYAFLSETLTECLVRQSNLGLTPIREPALKE